MPTCFFDTWALLMSCSVGSPRPPNQFKVKVHVFLLPFENETNSNKKGVNTNGKHTKEQIENISSRKMEGNASNCATML